MKSLFPLTPVLAMLASAAVAQDAPAVQPPNPAQDDEPVRVGVTGGHLAHSIAVPGHADAKRRRHAGRQHRGARPAGGRDRRRRPSQFRAVRADRSRPVAADALSSGQRARLSLFLRVRRRRTSSRASSRPIGDGAPDRRLLPLRRRRAEPAHPRGLRRPAPRLAPRGAPLRRHDLRAADRRGRLFRHPHRLRLGDRSGAAAGQAARDHGL